MRAVAAGALGRPGIPPCARMVASENKSYLKSMVCHTCEPKGHMVGNYRHGHADEQPRAPRANATDCMITEEQLVAAHVVIAAHALYYQARCSDSLTPVQPAICATMPPCLDQRNHFRFQVCGFDMQMDTWC